MINDREFLLGAAFHRLINFGEKVSITHLPNLHSALYFVETKSTKSVILFKISTKPKSSWSFSFSNGEESALNILHKEYFDVSVFIVLVCHKDGICCIGEDRLWSILDRDAKLSSQRISVSRQPRGSYHITGSGKQKMQQTVPQNNWPSIILLNEKNSHE